MIISSPVWKFLVNLTRQNRHSSIETDAFAIRTGVGQGCLLSPLLFLLTIDWIMKTTTSTRNGIQWTLIKQLADLEFADNTVYLAGMHF